MTVKEEKESNRKDAKLQIKRCTGLESISRVAHSGIVGCSPVVYGDSGQLAESREERGNWGSVSSFKKPGETHWSLEMRWGMQGQGRLWHFLKYC